MTILDGCKKDARESQKELYGHFYSYAMSICLRYSRTREDATEVLNDGFMKIFGSLHKFHYDPSHPAKQVLYTFQSWMKKIMVFTAIDRYRAGERHAWHQDIELQARRLSTAETATTELTSRELLKLVQQLSPAYRNAFNLFVIEGFSHEEISAALDISVGTSKSNLAKARENLRKMLKKTYGEIYSRYE